LGIRKLNGEPIDRTNCWRGNQGSAKFQFPFSENSSVPAQGVGVLIFQGLFMCTKNSFLLFATGLKFHSGFPN
jgi:hypothetical protein